MNFKINFSSRYYLPLLLILIALLTWHILYLKLKIKQNHDSIVLLHNSSYVDSNLQAICDTVEGQIMDNIVLHNVKGKKYLGDLFENHDFFIAVYQNGMVCDPCLEFIQNYWAENSQKFPQGLSDKLIIIGSKNSRDTFVFLKRYNLENSYFIDINQYIQKNLLLSNILPVNFLFLIDKKLHIVYISYFTTIVKDQFKSFVSKSKKLINEKK